MKTPGKKLLPGLGGTTALTGSAPLPKPRNAAADRLVLDLQPFGERFRANIKGQGFDINLIYERRHVAKLRDRCNELLKEGRAVGRKRRARDAKESKS